MQIWFYYRECQLGDYVYADASTSDRVNKAKTVVGVCFHIDPKDKSRRLCVATSNLQSNSWGLYKFNWPTGITLTDTPDYNVFDVPTLTNKTKNGQFNINSETYRDETDGDVDGFKIFPSDSGLAEFGWIELTENLDGHPIGTMLPWGLVNTLKIIAHRNRILNDSNVNLPMPSKAEGKTEYESLLEVMQNIVDRNGNNENYKQYYYPAASECYAYEPALQEGEQLSDRFKAHNWFLASAGEVTRLYWYSTHKQNQEPSSNGIFANGVEANIISPFSSYVRASTEYDDSNAYYIIFSTGSLAGFNGGKHTSYAIRPICAF